MQPVTDKLVEIIDGEVPVVEEPLVDEPEDIELEDVEPVFEEEDPR